MSAYPSIGLWIKQYTAHVGKRLGSQCLGGLQFFRVNVIVNTESAKFNSNGDEIKVVKNKNNLNDNFEYYDITGHVYRKDLNIKEHD